MPGMCGFLLLFESGNSTALAAAAALLCGEVIEVQLARCTSAAAAAA